MKENIIADTVLMIEPIAFGFNKQTAMDNLFQENDSVSPKIIQEHASKEFNCMVNELIKSGIEVIQIKDTHEPHTPDSIFPNNWVSFHSDGTVVLYPMYAENRRDERREDILKSIENKGFYINQIIDYTQAEKENLYLEGTGSMVLDRENKIAYASLSERTNEFIFLEFCEEMGYTPITFHALQEIGDKKFPIYHTNVMMGVCKGFCLICLETIHNEEEKRKVVNSLKSTGKEIIPISIHQMKQFLGNHLQLKSKIDGTRYLVVSQTAYQSITQEQLKKIKNYTEIIVCNIPTIEKYGGGGVRCMLAEIFLPKAIDKDCKFFA
ncbi:amidinotransferase [Apibacter muscae]|uniref:citrulline utilization hydrolase CtlX n=1 Tax=Apibacter muscae TaxID=2509004 RepID=UPI0011ACA93F|nr:arginine deiminase-related protein [Apibacter muscae]TWP24815.1 amidinotransferase [Apibacter muscae]